MTDEKLISAKEMFEDVGLKESKSPFADCIEYGTPLSGHIVFDKTYKMFHANTTINAKLLKAIIKQCQELGWLDD